MWVTHFATLYMCQLRPASQESNNNPQEPQEQQPCKCICGIIQTSMIDWVCLGIFGHRDMYIHLSVILIFSGTVRPQTTVHTQMTWDYGGWRVFLFHVYCFAQGSTSRPKLWSIVATTRGPASRAGFWGWNGVHSLDAHTDEGDSLFASAGKTVERSVQPSVNDLIVQLGLFASPASSWSVLNSYPLFYWRLLGRMSPCSACPMARGPI